MENYCHAYMDQAFKKKELLYVHEEVIRMVSSILWEACDESQGMTLKSGTIIATGTPGGVGMGMKPPVFLKKKDVVTCEIEGIGSLVNSVG